MTERARLSRIAGGDRPLVTPGPASFRIEVALPGAKVIPLPFQSRRYIDDVVSTMLGVGRAKGEHFLSREKQVITEDLVGAGADRDAVERALLTLEGAVRRRIWELVLMTESRR